MYNSLNVSIFSVQIIFLDNVQAVLVIGTSWNTIDFDKIDSNPRTISHIASPFFPNRPTVRSYWTHLPSQYLYFVFQVINKDKSSNVHLMHITILLQFLRCLCSTFEK